VLTIFATTFFQFKKIVLQKNTSNEGDNVNVCVDVLT